MEMNDVTVGTKCFIRADRLKLCLESIEESPHNFKEVIVADDGEITDEKEKIYSEYREKLPLKVLDLEYDYGIGGSRNEVFEEMSGDYLLWMDTDMIMPENVTDLKRILENDEGLGGVSGLLLEEGEFRAGAHNFKIQDTLFGKVLLRDTFDQEKNKITTDLGEKTIFYFDMVQMGIMFRKECLEDGKWDEEYITHGEHTDFFLNQTLNTDWKFAHTPEVIFNHYPGGSDEYTVERHESGKKKDSIGYFKEKWNLDYITFRDKFHDKDAGFSRDIKTLIKRSMPSWMLGKLQETDILPLRKREATKVEEE
jgi:GT2 family glycosyltransferase